MVRRLHDPTLLRVYAYRRCTSVPLPRLEYSASASLQVMILLLISGGRAQSEVASVFVLMATTMAFGYLTEARHCLVLGRSARSTFHLNHRALSPGNFAPRPSL